MKKIIMLIGILFIFSISNVLAQDYKLTLDKQDNIYYARTGGSLPYKSSQFSIYLMNGEIAYCIEPSKNITTWNYIDSSDLIDSPYSSELTHKLELIGYYGREYPNHDDVKYSMAAQALIWELTSGQKVTFWTKRYEEGDKIDITKEKNEIINLVNLHEKKPNFNEEYQTLLNKELFLEDNDNILNNYTILDNGGNNVEIIDNKLVIVPKIIGESEIILTRKKYDDKKTLLFIGSDKDNSQTLGRLRDSQDINLKIKLNTKCSIEIYKIGENINYLDNEIIYSDFNLSGSIFGLYNMDDSLITQIIVDNNGYGKYSNLDIGKYYLKEIETDSKYKLDENKYIFEISNISYDTDVVKTFEIKNYLKKGTFHFIKEDLITKEKIPDTIIDIYDENNQLILEKVTNSNGIIEIDNMPVGKYYLEEKMPNKMYYLSNEKIFFEIIENEITNQVMFNEKIKVPKTSRYDEVYINIISSFLLIISIGIGRYERKIKNN